MNEPKICPLLTIGRTSDLAYCMRDNCAWWCAGMCGIASAASRIWDIADQLDVLNMTLDEQENAALRGSNTQSGDKVEQDLAGTVAASTINENGGNVK